MWQMIIHKSLWVSCNVLQKLVNVRYKFKDDMKFISIKITEQQYENLQELPMIENCKILR